MTRRRLRDDDVHRVRVAVRLSDRRLTHAWSGTMLIGDHDLATIPRDLLLRAAVATVEPRSALGGVSAIERMTSWGSFEREIVVVADRGHRSIPAHEIVFRRVSDIERELYGMREIDGVPTTAALAAILHAARDLTSHQAANALKKLQYHEGLQLPDVERALAERARVVGAPRLRRGIELVASGSAGTKGRTEDLLLPHVTRRYGEPLVNLRGCTGIPDYEPDFCWPAQRWIVEVDGRPHTEDPAVKAADEARDKLLRAAGWTVVRIPWGWVWRRLAYTLRVIDRAFHP